MNNFLTEILLIKEPSVVKLYQKIVEIAEYFIPLAFTLSLILELIGDLNFASVLKRLVVSILFISFFYSFHTQTVNLALSTSDRILREVSPRSIFVRNWYQQKVTTKKLKNWSWVQKFFIPDLNDLLGTSFFLLAKLLLWILKLIYSTVYHLTYVFTGIFALLYFFGWTKDALKGAVQSTIWCAIFPFIVVAILALVGNSIDERARAGVLAINDINTILWLVGVTMILLITPVIAYGIVKGEGIHAAGSAAGKMAINSGMHIGRTIPIIASNLVRFRRHGSKLVKNVKGNILKSGRAGQNSAKSNFREMFVKGSNKTREQRETSVLKGSSLAKSNREKQSAHVERRQKNNPAKQTVTNTNKMTTKNNGISSIRKEGGKANEVNRANRKVVDNKVERTKERSVKNVIRRVPSEIHKRKSNAKNRNRR